MANLSSGFFRTFDQCALLGEGECSLSISQDPANPDGEQVFIHSLDTRFLTQGETPKPLLTEAEMLERCKLCEQFRLHNPTTALQNVCIRQCGQELGTFPTNGILIQGSVA